VLKLAEYLVGNNEVKLPEFFDFIGEFVKRYNSNFSEDNLRTIMDALVQRVLKEVNIVNAPAKKTLDLRPASQEQ